MIGRRKETNVSNGLTGKICSEMVQIGQTIPLKIEKMQFLEFDSVDNTEFWLRLSRGHGIIFIRESISAGESRLGTKRLPGRRLTWEKRHHNVWIMEEMVS